MKTLRHHNISIYILYKFYAKLVQESAKIILAEKLSFMTSNDL